MGNVLETLLYRLYVKGMSSRAIFEILILADFLLCFKNTLQFIHLPLEHLFGAYLVLLGVDLPVRT